MKTVQPPASAFSRRSPTVGVIGPNAQELSAALAETDGRFNVTPVVVMQWGALHALVVTLDASLPPLEFTQAADELAAKLLAASRAAGKALCTGGLPAFVTLIKCEFLADAGDDLATWFEKVEALKHQLQARLEGGWRGQELQASFGGLSPRAWAVSLRRPALVGSPEKRDEAWGVRELALQVALAAKDFRRRQRRQPWRMTWITSLLLLITSTLLSAPWVIRGTRLDGWLAVPEAWFAPAPPKASPTETARALAHRGRRLIRFDDFMGIGATTLSWSDWDVAVADWLEGLASVRGSPFPHEFQQRLEQIAEDVSTLRTRAALLGLIAGVPNAPPLLQLPPADPSNFDPAKMQAMVRDRLRHLPREYFQDQPPRWPAEVPYAVVTLLQGRAAIQYERLLDHWRFAVRVEAFPFGWEEEPPDRWRTRALAWLDGPGAATLADWQALAQILGRLARGDDHADPVGQLRSFLATQEFYLPTRGLDLRLPEAIQLADQALVGLRPTGEAALLRLEQTNGDFNEIPFVPEPSPLFPGKYELRPPPEQRDVPITWGTQITLRLRLVDSQGRGWLLSWTSQDAVARAVGFTVLAEAPRLQPANETDPLRGMIAHEVRLTFFDLRALRLPELFPR